MCRNASAGNLKEEEEGEEAEEEAAVQPSLMWLGKC